MPQVLRWSVSAKQLLPLSLLFTIGLCQHTNSGPTTTGVVITVQAFQSSTAVVETDTIDDDEELTSTSILAESTTLPDIASSADITSVEETRPPAPSTSLDVKTTPVPTTIIATDATVIPTPIVNSTEAVPTTNVRTVLTTSAQPTTNGDQVTFAITSTEEDSNATAPGITTDASENTTDISAGTPTDDSTTTKTHQPSTATSPTTHDGRNLTTTAQRTTGTVTGRLSSSHPPPPSSSAADVTTAVTSSTSQPLENPTNETSATYTDQTDGPLPDRCSRVNFFISSDGICTPCRCVQDGTSKCNQRTGDCICLPNVVGELCDSCAEKAMSPTGHLANCQLCDCDPVGAVGCNTTGSCECQGNVNGIRCDRCEKDFYAGGGHLDNCIPCPCDRDGTLRCNPGGSCTCKRGFGGDFCHMCVAGFYGGPGTGCSKCNCDAAGTKPHSVCDRYSGQCSCLENSEGRACDQCRQGYYRPTSADAYTENCPGGCLFNPAAVCQACNCHPTGSVNSSCTASGSCHCRAGVIGSKCDDCPAGRVFTVEFGCIAPSTFLPFGPGTSDAVLSSYYPYFIQTVSLTMPDPPPAFGAQQRFAPFRQWRATISSGGYVSFNFWWSWFGSQIGFYPNRFTLNRFFTYRPVLAPFWSETDARYGKVFYRLDDSLALRQWANQELAKRNPAAADGFRAERVLVVTWVGMRAYPAGQFAVEQGLSDLGQNSFQLVFAWDGCVSFAFYNYAGGAIAWNRRWQSSQSGANDGYFRVDNRTINANRTSRVFVLLTRPCQGFLLDDRNCRRQTASLAPLNIDWWMLSRVRNECPPTLFHALRFFLYRFVSLRSGVACFTPASTFGIFSIAYPVCCYRTFWWFPWWWSSLISWGSDAGFVTRPNVGLSINEEFDIRDTCCRAWSCQRFFNKRPRVSSFFFRWWFFFFGFTGGDPHIDTLDGIRYTFNGYGEYRLLSAPHKTTDGRLELQARFQPPVNSSATVITAVAMGYYNTSTNQRQVSVHAGLFNSSLQVVVDGTTDLTSNITAMPNSATDSLAVNEFLSIRKDNNETTFVLPGGAGITLKVSERDNISIITTTYSIPAEFQGNHSNGLLGVYNRNTTDDFLARNGTEYSTNTSERVLFTFGESWRLMSNESLFYYQPGQNYATFYRPDHIPRFSDELNISSLSPEVRQACGNNRECLFDATETGSISFGKQTSSDQKTFDNEGKNAANLPPTIESTSSKISAELNKQVMFTFNVTDSPGDTFTVYLRGKPPPEDDYTIVRLANSSEHVFSWTPRNRSAVIRLQIVANDTLGAVSELHVLVILCGCENNHSCVAVDPTVDGGEDRFISPECNCSEAYSGRYCEQDTDGCATGSGCYDGVNCTDVKAPGTGFTCGLCPSGMNGTGVTCTDINECHQPVCDIKARCINTFASFTCRCNRGYTGSGISCNDIDECSGGQNNCHSQANCTNSAGSYRCACQAGYRGNGTFCREIDECALRIHNCHRLSTCRNTIGSFQCDCISGYQGNGVSCSDLNECSSSNRCHANALCDNTPGSYICTCKAGYSGNGDSTASGCQDMDECILGLDTCKGNSTCMNTQGFYKCPCDYGFTGNGWTLCTRTNVTLTAEPTTLVATRRPDGGDSSSSTGIAIAAVAGTLLPLLAVVGIVIYLKCKTRSGTASMDKGLFMKSSKVAPITADGDDATALQRAGRHRSFSRRHPSRISLKSFGENVYSAGPNTGSTLSPEARDRLSYKRGQMPSPRIIANTRPQGRSNGRQAGFNGHEMVCEGGNVPNESNLPGTSV